MLTLVKHRLPPLWDGAEVTWHKFTAAEKFFICPPPKKPEARCSCGSMKPPLIAAGLRAPEPGSTVDTTRARTGRWGRTVHVPTVVPAWPVYDLTAFRCPDCGQDEVWDQRTDEWWTLDESDYGSAGSARPFEREWTGGLFDLLPDPEPVDSGRES